MSTESQPDWLPGKAPDDAFSRVSSARARPPDMPDALATPGARTVNVPQWAEFVAVHIVGSDDTAVPYTDLASIASDFAAAFSQTGNGAIATAAGGWVCTAPVANWAAGRSVTIAFTQANSLAGAHAFVCFIQDTTGVTAPGHSHAR